MSLIKSIRQQLGLSGTPANNFTLDASADNGTMKLARGNAGATTQDIMTVDAAGKVAFPQMARTWQNLTGSRVVGTTYTNTTGQDIDVAVYGTSTGVGATANMTIGGVAVRSMANTAATQGIGMVVTVPPGATYALSTSTGVFTIINWQELRA